MLAAVQWISIEATPVDSVLICTDSLSLVQAMVTGVLNLEAGAWLLHCHVPLLVLARYWAGCFLHVLHISMG